MPVISKNEENCDFSNVTSESDIKAICARLRSTKPPYECPVDSCRKLYKSYSGLEYHLYRYDHKEPIVVDSVCKDDTSNQVVTDGTIKVILHGKMQQINVFSPLKIISEEQNLCNAGPNNDLIFNNSAKDVVKSKKDINISNCNSDVKLPEASFRILEKSATSKVHHRRSKTFYRHLEKTADELDELVEYDMDEAVS